MSASHPFLAADFYIRWSELTPERVVADIELALERAEKNIDELCATDRGRMTFESTFLALEKATEELSRAWGLVGHLDSVCNSADLRPVYNQMLPRVSEFFARIPLNESLWDLLRTFADTPAAKQLDAVQRRFLEETMADFRQNGADLPPDRKSRLEAIEAELAEITQKFGENVLDSTNAWELIIDNEAQLAGLPDTARANALSDAKRKGIADDHNPKWRFTLHMPSYLPLMEHLDEEGLRRQAWRGSCSIGRGGKHDNTELIWRILGLRHEKAQLLGKDNFADLVLERRMAKSGRTALTFVEDLHDRIGKAFRREISELQEFRAEALSQPAGALEPWDVAYWTEKRRKALFNFDDEELRPYFPIDRVINGMFKLAERVFDVTIRERETAFLKPGDSDTSAPRAEDGGPVEVWHPEVRFYEIFNARGAHLGSFYADWHPRESKRGGAWMNYLITGLPPTDETDRHPHLGLICGNMTPASDERPALLTHSEVETIFHEFGHLLHHLLGEVPIKSLNGVNVAWDFVELPSQIMENFCWTRESLDFFARHYKTGKPIPSRLFKRMIAARNYMSASTTMRQLAFAKLDLELHIRFAGESSRDLDDLAEEILTGYQLPLATRPPTMARRFTHLFSAPTGYAAGYYSYKWAEVLDADAFTRFEKEGVLNPAVGLDFRDTILSKGNSEDPSKLFRDFMGRDPDITALLVRAGLA